MLTRFVDLIQAMRSESSRNEVATRHREDWVLNGCGLCFLLTLRLCGLALATLQRRGLCLSHRNIHKEQAVCK